MHFLDLWNMILPKPHHCIFFPYELSVGRYKLYTCVSCCYSLNLFLLLVSDLNIFHLHRVSVYAWRGHFTLVKNLYLFHGIYETVPFYDFEGSKPEVTEKLEEVVMIWIKQIRQVLVESEQMRREADDIGPSAELEHWKARMSSFNRLNPCIISHRV